MTHPSSNCMVSEAAPMDAPTGSMAIELHFDQGEEKRSKSRFLVSLCTAEFEGGCEFGRDE